jgi:hypothetical protein
MKDKIAIKVDIQVDKGPRVEISQSLELEGYDPFSVMVPFKKNNVPGTAVLDIGLGTQVRFLLIKPPMNLKEGRNLQLSYKINKQNPIISLDEPHFYLGKGPVSVLGTDIETITFSNDEEKPQDSTEEGIGIEIFAGRNVVVVPPA